MVSVASTWQTLILIPEGKIEFHRIGLVKVLWKAVVSLLNHRLTAAITFQNVPHMFREGRGKGNAALEAKLFQKITAKG